MWGGEHDVYSKLPYTVIELHRTCYTHNEILDKYFLSIWNRSQKREEMKFSYEMIWDDFYLFLIGHMAKHFLYAGIGIRSLLDLVVFKEKLEKKCDREYIENMLKQASFWEIEKKLNNLSQRCFNQKTMDSTEEKLFEFILKSGLQGTSKNSIGFEIVKNGNTREKILKNQIKLIKEYTFPSKKRMKEKYFYVKKYPFLLPIAWIHRGIYYIIFERKKVFVFIKNISNRKNANKIIEIHKEAGLD